MKLPLALKTIYLAFCTTIVASSKFQQSNEANHLQYARIYSKVGCRDHWLKTTRLLLARAGFTNDTTYDVGNLKRVTQEEMGGMYKALELSLRNGRIYCSVNENSSKWARAFYFIRRLVEIVAKKQLMLPNIDFIAHVSDQPRLWGEGSPQPVIGVSGTHFSRDLAALPFASLSDIVGSKERESVRRSGEFQERWRRRKQVAFFCGGPSDCPKDSNTTNCPRIRTVMEAHNEVASSSLRNIRICGRDAAAITRLKKLYNLCPNCVGLYVNPKHHGERLQDVQYLVNLDGAGPWSRRMSVLLGAGAAVLQHFSYGWQFYDVGLDEGVHFYRFFSAPHGITLKYAKGKCDGRCDEAFRRTHEEERRYRPIHEVISMLEKMELDAEAAKLRVVSSPQEDEMPDDASSITHKHKTRRRQLLKSHQDNVTAAHYPTNEWMAPRFVARSSESFARRCLRHSSINEFIAIFLRELAKHQVGRLEINKMRLHRRRSTQNRSEHVPRQGVAIDITSTGITKSGAPCNGQSMRPREKQRILDELRRHKQRS